jgi:hypothetical protein
MTTTYPDKLSLQEARDRYFQDNGFGADGGYADDWVDLKIAGIPTPFPNTALRKRAVPFHDLHHIVTGYGTDFPGECEVSAWEIGAGCKREVVAWQLDLGLTFLGAVIAPRRTFAAFVRGRRGRSFYGEDYASLLALEVCEAKRRLGTDRPPARANATDGVLFAATIGAGAAVGTMTALIFLPLAPIGVLAGRLRRRAAA